LLLLFNAKGEFRNMSAQTSTLFTPAQRLRFQEALQDLDLYYAPHGDGFLNRENGEIVSDEELSQIVRDEKNLKLQEILD
jgi:hypothetical protein